MKMDTYFSFSETWKNYTSALIVLATVVLIIYSTKKRHVNLPPGPTGYPFIGNVLDLHPSKVLGNFRKWRMKYGDLFAIHFGTKLAVVVNGYDNLKERFRKKGGGTSDRPSTYLFKDILQESGVVSSSGRVWKTQRIFAVKFFRNFVMEKHSIETIIMEEVSVFLKEMDQHNRKSFNPDGLVDVCVSNIICSITFGQRFNHGDETFKTLLRLIADIFEKVGQTGTLNAFPFLKYLPGDPFAGKRLLRDCKSLHCFVQSIIDRHKTTYDERNLRDFIDMYLKETSVKSEFDKSFSTDEQLRAIISELFVAGSETSSTTLKWFVLYLLNNPDVQSKMAREIQATVGMSRLPSLTDKQNLPYCEAVLTEVMRHSNIAPLSALHFTSADVHMHGFKIPKGSILIQNLDSVMMDPKLFLNPDKFLPERFIDDEGLFVGYEKVIPFGIGRRVCLGESLARAQLFLFSTSLVQRFELLPVEGNPVPSLHGTLGITYVPDAFEFVPVERKQHN